MTDSVINTPAPPREKKRTRVQLSCTACRSRKLKCCRTHPCTNCIKRGEAQSCTFVGRGPKSKSATGRTSPALVQERVQHLENLILSLVQKKQIEESENEAQSTDVSSERLHVSPQSSGHAGAQTTSPSSVAAPDAKGSPLDPSSKLVVGETGMSYIDGAHWSAILEEINGVKEYLQDGDFISDEETVDVEVHNSDEASPTLLLGLAKPASMEELLSDIPPRPVTDRLIYQFVNTKEPLIAIFHIPVFLKEYHGFWNDPKNVSLPFLALIYGALTLVASTYFRLDEPLPTCLGDVSEVIKTFRKRAAQCLAQSNYIVPERHKVKALLVYTMGEFYRSNDAQASVSFLLSITIKLAMRTGYHRDPHHFPASVTPFGGELRRRLWTVLRQLDILVSFQVGLPRTIQDWQQDVELPRNLFDEDFDEDVKELPPSRPETELTKMSYMRSKARIMMIFGRISDIAFSRGNTSYEETLELDKQLEDAHEKAGTLFRMKPIQASITDSTDVILQRYMLELLYLKARCVLHRRYLGEVHNNIRFAYSRWACLSASKDILRHQADLHHETQPGGILYRDRLFPNSLQYTDYLLASMIICLELSFGNGEEAQKRDPQNDIAVVIKGREDLLTVLQTTHEIFEKARRQSADAQKAYVALTIMLRRIQKGQQGEQPVGQAAVDSMGLQATGLPIVHPPPYGSWQNMDTPYVADATNGSVPNQMDAANPTFASLDVIDEMIDAPANINWRQWDQQILGLYTGDMGGATWWETQGPV